MLDKSAIQAITQMVIDRLTNSAKPSKTPSTTRVIDYLRSAQAEQRNQPEITGKENEPGKENELKKSTPARIRIGRAGPRPKTADILTFRADHAAAVDAVYGEADDQLLQDLNFFTVETLIDSKEAFLLRPDYGRRLNDEGVLALKQRCRFAPQVQIAVSDGLSSQAINTNMKDVFQALEQSLSFYRLTIGTPFFIKNGRVAVMDHIGEILQPEVVVLLIGERPGLVTASSLSAYLCYRPRFGTIEADRMVISNIHAGGTPPIEAGAYLGKVVQTILQHKASGVALATKQN